MTTQIAIALTLNIADVPGVNARSANIFRDLGIRCVADLLLHLPMRYEHQLPEQTIEAAGRVIGPNHGAEANIAVTGEVATVRGALSRRSPFTATLQDPTGTIKLSWFNSPWMKGKLHPGMRIRVHGRAKRHGDYIEMANPKWEPERTEAPTASGSPGSSGSIDSSGLHGSRSTRPERWAPVYPASEGLPSQTIERAVATVLEPALAALEDHLPPDYRRKRELPSLAEAYRMVHAPRNEDDIKSGRRRLVFDELLLLQLGVMMKRHHRHEDMTAIPLKLTDTIHQRIIARFPFELTASQRKVIDEVAADLISERPMNRLVQGDVGSGKTVVALYAMLMAVASGHQAALMAPTELLAEQHFGSISRMLEGGKVRIELLTGSLPPAERRSVLDRLARGEIDILIGTHALLSGDTTFKSLALAVIDEQHRFGVHQRATLRAKGPPASAAGPAPGAAETQRSDAIPTVPHILVMTATPIPRTLSLTIFGDLDISTIDGLPPGRTPIITKHVPHARDAEVYTYIADRLAGGEQAYIVVPVIDESQSGLKDVGTLMERLESGPFHNLKLAAMHGRLDREERDAIMQRFRSPPTPPNPGAGREGGQIHALIATTVIEVGVDVPNASIMVIEHADRFGLAQLHQLRGRIGRGTSKTSLCVLIADPATPDGAARIEAMLETNDGFKIAEKDFDLRGPGELFGTRQSGASGLRISEFPRDTALLTLARHDAQEWIALNPTLAGEADALLRRRLLKAHGESLGLGDVG